MFFVDYFLMITYVGITFYIFSNIVYLLSFDVDKLSL